MSVEDSVIMLAVTWFLLITNDEFKWTVADNVPHTMNELGTGGLRRPPQISTQYFIIPRYNW
ncbi:hypothetical protein C8J57DRAFT_1499982 [Mycena rebaudengoi]|nr:hypothetical protein C8J57DRAFT_1499982 [Mycena rebaudengoi]